MLSTTFSRIASFENRKNRDSHITPEFRGLLPFNCSTSFGIGQDNMALLTRFAGIAGDYRSQAADNHDRAQSGRDLFLTLRLDAE